MQIEIKIDKPLTALNQAKLHQIRRVATVLRSDGWEVVVIAPVEDITLLEAEKDIAKQMALLR